MGFLLSRLGRYLLVRTILGVTIALVGVLASILLIDLVEQMRTVGTRTELSVGEALRLTLLKTPMLIEQTLPFVVLAGSMIAIIGLNRSSELVALRAAGISAWRFLTPSAFLGLVVGVLVVLALNPVGAAAYRIFEEEKSAEISGTGNSNASGVWIRQGDREGQIVIHADGVEANGSTLLGATFIFFEEQQEVLRFTRRIRAERAELRPGFWQLSNLVEATPGARPVSQAHLAIPTTLDANELIDRFVTPASLSFWQLPGFIREAREAGFAPTRYELKWQTLLAYPLLLAAMAALGAAFSLQLQRLGNLAHWGAAGVGIGLFLFFYSQLAGAFAINQSVPALVAAWSGPAAGLFIAMSMVAFLEDG
ncbi:MAG: LPS export ABC transporter permease LptG [Hyphomonadaceae bacterium]|nr:LPS export ABC transporter permease LptG [Hyphomonadaceae bacterium]MBX3510717.1 LPS export ABC transporter permease LptG [Hyphomonadaceae bacterium]